MSTLTAEILIGAPHIYHGGIAPTHYLFLSENSKPAWILIKENVARRGGIGKKIVWIPNVENMLEIGFLMVAYHVLKDENIINMSEELNSDIKKDFVHFYSLFDEKSENELYKLCKNLKQFPKLIISIFQTSTLLGQLHVIEKYNMDVEVCLPVYTRQYSAWSEKVEIKGNLNNSYLKRGKPV